MPLTRMLATVERRLLINFRAEPDAVRRFLPTPFEPDLVSGHAVVGMCLIRLRDLRPAVAPVRLGRVSEHLAHRIAILAPRDGKLDHGVYVPRRETDSRTGLLGSRAFFSGGLHLARFSVNERPGSYRIDVSTGDGIAVHLDAELVDELPGGSVFTSLDAASQFFRAGTAGYSDGRRAGIFDGVRLQMASWCVRPLRIVEATSSLLDGALPAGSFEIDSGFLMANIESVWSAMHPIHVSAELVSA